MTDAKSIQSMGGKARAKSLSAEQRSDIARTAALAKWENDEDRAKLPKVSAYTQKRRHFPSSFASAFVSRT